MKKVMIFCDGACSGNPGPGGWGAILRFQEAEKEISGSEAHTTNNRMELLGCINALKLLKEPCDITICTDSQYLANAFQKGWIDKWQKNGWRTSGKDPVKNKELWLDLIDLTRTHKVNWTWIRGHAGHPENERCDQLAVTARDRAREL